MNSPVFYYLTKIWSDVEDNCKFPWLGKSEIDIFIPELKLAIEYDGERWHKDVLKDISKDELLIQHQLDIIRFREPKCPMINDASLCIYTEKPVANASHMNGAIKVLFDILNEKYKNQIEILLGVECNILDNKGNIDLTEKNYNSGFAQANNIGIKKAINDGSQYI